MGKDLSDVQLHALVKAIQNATDQRKKDWLYSDLYEACKPQIWNAVHKYCKRPEYDRSEALSLASQAIWTAVDRFDESRGRFKGLLAKIIRFDLLTFQFDEDYYQQKGINFISLEDEQNGQEDLSLKTLLVSRCEKDDRASEARLELAYLWRRLEPELSDQERVIAHEYWGKGKNQAAAAKKLKIKQKAIDNALVRVKEKAAMLCRRLNLRPSNIKPNSYTTSGAISTLTIRNMKGVKFRFLLSTDRLPEIQKYQWRVIQPFAYAKATDGRLMQLRRLAAGVDPFVPVHVHTLNRDLYDLRSENLRVIPFTNNSAMQPFCTQENNPDYVDK